MAAASFLLRRVALRSSKRTATAVPLPLNLLAQRRWCAPAAPPDQQPQQQQPSASAAADRSQAAGVQSATDASPLSETANSYIGLGSFETMADDAGRMATGISYLEDALRVQEEAYQSESDPRKRARRGLSFAQNLLQVGRQHHQQQDPVEASQFYQRGIKIVEDSLAATAKDGSPAGLRAMRFGSFLLSELISGLGVAHNDMGRGDEALAAHQRALELRRESVGKSHPSLAECFNNMGALYYAKGNLSKAEELYEQALERLMEANGGREDGPHIALTHYNIGLSRAGQGNLHAAASSLRRAMKLAEVALGSDHRQVEMIRETLKQWGAPVPSQ